MKYRTLALLFCAFLLYCPKRHTPDVDRIKVVYLSSLYEDIQSEKPLLAGVKDTDGVVLAHIMTQPRYLSVLLKEFGFFDLLSETGIDYIIADPGVLNLDNINYFIIPYDLGYVITNYEGIRFAILSKGKDSLTIQDQITVEIVNQRSDIMWVIDPVFLESPPMTYYFYVQNRGLADTSATPIQPVLDTLLAYKLQECAQNVQEVLARSITLGEQSIKEFTLATLAHNEEADVILYPPDMFRVEPAAEMLTIGEFMEAVACEQRFQKETMTQAQTAAVAQEHGLIVWGAPGDTNTVLYPAVHGEYLFDMLSLVVIPVKY